MTQRVIPIAERRFRAELPAVPREAVSPSGDLRDARGRLLHDLRVSVTDRCNFRCTYCMPKETFGKDHAFLPHASLLTFEEIERLVRICVEHGVRKVRLTGGEPLLRRNLEVLIAKLALIRTVEGEPLDLTLTTNGSLLTRKAQVLRDAGLSRLTVSLDALDDTVFRAMNDVDYPVDDVLRGIEAAHWAGFGPVKVNMVVKRGVNDDQIVPMARHFRGTGDIVRFIEFMDVGMSNGWRMDDVLPSREVVARIDAHHRLEPVDRSYGGEVAERWRYLDGAGEIGVISSVTHAFCRDCTRARLSTEGRLYTCLFAESGSDLRALVREGCSDADLSGAIAQIWRRRDDRYSETRTAQTTALRKIEMSYIGG